MIICIIIGLPIKSAITLYDKGCPNGHFLTIQKGQNINILNEDQVQIHMKKLVNNEQKITEEKIQMTSKYSPKPTRSQRNKKYGNNEIFIQSCLYKLSEK